MPAETDRPAMSQAAVNASRTTPLKVAVVVPTYNEAENLPMIVERLSALDIDGLGFIVVDDASPDGTGELAEHIAATYDTGVFQVIHRLSKQGLGRAYIQGFRRALEEGAEAVVEMDADLSHPPAELPKMLARLEETGADVVVGSRYMEGGGVDPKWSWVRRQISHWGNVGIRFLLGLKVRDATSGFKVFRRSALEHIGLERLRVAGFGFQAEVAYRCERMGLNVVEHPYEFLDRSAGQSKMSLGIVIEALYRLTLLRIRG